MKNAIQIILLFFIGGNLFSQTYPSLRFRKPTTSDNITWRFTHVISGVDAYITVLGNKNASLNRIDDSSTYAHAWNPFIRINSGAGATDSSYVHFRITFVNNGSGSNATLGNLAMTAVDLDGSGKGGYREMVRTSLPATPKSIVGTNISSYVSSTELTLISGITSYSSTDTSNYAAMSQINYSNVHSYTVKVGVVGAVTSSTTRQFSFYFKPFSSLVYVLPVKLIGLSVVSNNEVPVVKWSTTSEENANRFEVYRSTDGINYTLAGSVAANGNSHVLSHYTFSDNGLFGQQIQHVYYKLRMVDNNGEYAWSTIVHYGVSSETAKTAIASVYPNPSKGQLNVAFSSVSDNEYAIEVVDIFGKVYRSMNSSELAGQYQVSFDLSDLSHGVYFIRLSENGSLSTVKFIRD